MILFIDVNIWLYGANPQSPHYEPVRKALRPYWEGTKDFAVSWQVFYEFVRSATDPRLYARLPPSFTKTEFARS